MSRNDSESGEWDEKQIMNDRTSNTTRIFRLLRKSAREGKLSAEETHELVELSSSMAGSNVIERLETNFDVQNAKIDAVNSKYTVLIWMTGFAGVVISVAIIFS